MKIILIVLCITLFGIKAESQNLNNNTESIDTILIQDLRFRTEQPDRYMSMQKEFYKYNYFDDSLLIIPFAIGDETSYINFSQIQINHNNGNISKNKFNTNSNSIINIDNLKFFSTYKNSELLIKNSAPMNFVIKHHTDVIKLNREDFTTGNNVLIYKPKTEYEVQSTLIDNAPIVTYTRDEVGSRFCNYFYRDSSSINEFSFMKSSDADEGYCLFQINYKKSNDKNLITSNYYKLNCEFINHDFLMNCANPNGNSNDYKYKTYPLSDTIVLMFFQTSSINKHNEYGSNGDIYNRFLTGKLFGSEIGHENVISYSDFIKLFLQTNKPFDEEVYSFDYMFYRKNDDQKYLFNKAPFSYFIGREFGMGRPFIIPDYMKYDNYTGNYFKYYIVPIDIKNHIIKNGDLQLLFGQNVSVFKSNVDGYYVLYQNESSILKFDNKSKIQFINNAEDLESLKGEKLSFIVDNPSYIFAGGATFKRYTGYTFPVIKIYDANNGKFIKEKALDFAKKGSEIVYMTIDKTYIHVLLQKEGVLSYHKRNLNYLIN